MKISDKLIMIVDDSTTNINILVETLKNQYRLTIAKSGEMAFERLSQQLPDLILLDVMMPDIDGFEVCRRLKAASRTRDIPIIFITAMDEHEQKNKGFELGAVDYITRPFHSSEVLARINTHLTLRQMHLTLREKNQITRKALAETSRQLDTLISNLPGMVYRCQIGENWTMAFVSDGCLELTGYPPGYFTEGHEPHFQRIAAPEDVTLINEKLDQAIENKNSFELLYRITTASGDVKWVLEHGLGVYDSAGKLIGTEGVISDITERQMASLALARENQQLKSKIMQQDRFGDIVGTSSAMQKVYESILKASSGEDCVIIYGPSGTGKELVAKEVHRNSTRKNKPFIPVNCGAIPENLFESEFFGHKKGAFSGAAADKKGILDMADGGTLFLDEIGEVSISTQVKLLRVMDGNGFAPLGGTKLRKPDIRFVCATNRDLQKRIHQKKIREDFFFRIHIIPITLPPLKDRKEDIPLLIEHFLNSYPKSDTTTVMTPETITKLIEYSWPGNVRQLQNILYQYLVLGKLEFLEPGVLERKSLVATSGGRHTLKKAMDEFEKKYLSTILDRNGSQKQKAAEILGMNRKTLFRKIKKYGLENKT